MSWISTNNLRRFADKLFHGNLSFGGSVTHNGATTFNGGVKVNTTKAEFAAPVSFTGTTTYKGNEIATVNNIIDSTPDLTPYMKKTADSNLKMGHNRIDFGANSIYEKDSSGETPLIIDASYSSGVSVLTSGDLLVDNIPVLLSGEVYTKTETEDKIKTLAPSPFNANKHLVFPSGAEIWVE